MIIVPVDELTELGVKIFTAQGATEDQARFLVDTLVEANLTGHDSHGIHYYAKYSERINNGFIKIDQKPVIVKETASSALIDGNWTFGQITAKKLTEVAVEKAKKSMVAGVGAFNCNHIGRLGYYTEMAAKENIITTMYANVGNPSVSVHNGLGKTFGTNPYSASVPTGSDTPFLVDYASSVVAHGKISVARAKHTKIPKHWTRDMYGRVTDDPNDIYDGGWLLPFGEYKGYGLQMISELLGAVLTGSRTGLPHIREPPAPNGVFMLAVNPEGFIGLDAFKEKTAQLLSDVKKLTPVSGERILIPGEPEKETKAQRLRDGIEIPEDTWGEIMKLCNRLGIETGVTQK
ncbi:MAG: Ldh family oxidoreductase [Candidatus Bathyarchaeota archaeon]|nr:Ldh family oxidoreductase [Candidatus Bathyarchaeota archaeon]